uniref:Hyaluronan and proteoglycan link protein 3 n=1 Tax=Suricata suricatta TaxID=37032 RepID=A0A673TFP1_SURSU
TQARSHGGWRGSEKEQKPPGLLEPRLRAGTTEQSPLPHLIGQSKWQARIQGGGDKEPPLVGAAAPARRELGTRLGVAATGVLVCHPGAHLHPASPAGIFNGVKLVVETPEETLFSQLGANVTLPCRYRYEPALLSPRPVRIKWWKLSEDGAPEQDVLVAIGLRHRSFGDYRGRVRLPQGGEREASLQIWDLRLEDSGRYRCEVIDGLEDESGLVELELRGVVFPYQHPRGRYQLNFHEAQRACEEQDAVVASFEQLFRAWEEGLDWCNAGWLQDASVQYPVTLARQRCGGLGLAPGVRSYGPRHRRLHRYDVFCFSAALKGECRGWAGTGRGGGGGGGGGGRIWGPLGPVCPLTWSPCRLWSHDWLRFERFVAVSHGSLV